MTLAERYEELRRLAEARGLAGRVYDVFNIREAIRLYAEVLEIDEAEAMNLSRPLGRS